MLQGKKEEEGKVGVLLLRVRLTRDVHKTRGGLEADSAVCFFNTRALTGSLSALLCAVYGEANSDNKQPRFVESGKSRARNSQLLLGRFL